MSRSQACGGLSLLRLTAAHLASLTALEDAHDWPTGGSTAWLSARLEEEDSVLVGLISGELLVGYAAVARLPFAAELQAILVDEGWRGRGGARRLLAGVVTQARDWGSERLLLEVRAGNAPAIALYQAAGFEEDGRRRGYYPPLSSAAREVKAPPPRPGGASGSAAREDALLMSLPLAVEGATGG